MYGEIDSIQILRTKKGESRGIALVQFTTDEEATAASRCRDFAEVRISRAPLWSEGVDLTPLNEFSVDVCAPPELRTAASLNELFASYSPFEIVKSALVFATPEAASRCASEFEHDSVSVFTFAIPAVVNATNAILYARAAFVRGYSSDDFPTLKDAFPTAAGITSIDKADRPGAIVYFGSASERDSVIAVAHGKHVGLSQLPLIVMPFFDEGAGESEIAIVYEPSLSLVDSVLWNRFPNALAVSSCSTLNCDSYGLALFRKGQAPADAWIVHSFDLRKAAKTFAAVDRRIVVVRDVTDEENIGEHLPGAKIARSGSTVVARFNSAMNASTAFSALARAGRVVDICVDHTSSTLGMLLLKGEGMDQGRRTVIASNLPSTMGNEGVKQLFASFGEIEFSAVIRKVQRKRATRCALVTFVTEDSYEKALSGTFESPYDVIRMSRIYGW
jgi:hypothetical protein